MKRTKRAFCLLLAAALCLGLCGCGALDEARAAHAVWQQDGTIRLGDAVYKQLPTLPENMELDNHGEERKYLTQPEVPVLLASQYGESVKLLQDGLFLKRYVSDTQPTQFYCREERYEELCALIDAGFPADGYYYAYGSTEFYDLTPAENAALAAVTVPENEYTLESSRREELSAILGIRSGDVRLHDTSTTCYDIFRMDCVYYVSTVGAQPVLYRVPDDLQATFAGIMTAVLQSMG